MTAGRPKMAMFWTIGHSTRTLNAFIGLLREAAVNTVVDVRRIPRSRANPQFGIDTLPLELLSHDISYKHLPELGGLRSHNSAQGPSPNAFWENKSFRNYADYAQTPPFATGLAKLRNAGRTRRCSIMCAEAVWWRCHRRIIADYLLAAGDTVFHILGPGKIEPARITPAAKWMPNGTLIYPEEPPERVESLLSAT